MNWTYFNLVCVDEGANAYKLVDEAGQALKKNGSLVLFASYEEADQYLRDNDIRGSIR